MRLVGGRELSAKIKKEAADEIAQLKLTPSLAVCLVGDNSASQIYVRNKKKACEEVGIKCAIHSFPQDISQQDLIKNIQFYNADPLIHGILVQLPLPQHINQFDVLNQVYPSKDVDGFHHENVGRLVQGIPQFIPCTPLGILNFIKHEEIQLVGKHVVVVNSSVVVGKPLSSLLLMEKATVTICHKDTTDLEGVCRNADLIVTAVGKADFTLTDKYCKQGVVIIDVGINKKDGKIIGDVDVELVKNIAGLLTVVPGGIGILTVSMLLKNVIQAVKLQKGK